jgi:hypothetical protein
VDKSIYGLVDFGNGADLVRLDKDAVAAVLRKHLHSIE